MADNTEQRLAALEANQKNIFHQLDEHKAKIDDITRLTISIEKLAMKMDNVQTSVDKVDKRITALEKQPVTRWEKIKDVLISVIISTIVGGIIGAILTHL